MQPHTPRGLPCDCLKHVLPALTSFSLNRPVAAFLEHHTRAAPPPINTQQHQALVTHMQPTPAPSQIFNQLVAASSQKETPQCFLLTPKLLSGLKYRWGRGQREGVAVGNGDTCRSPLLPAPPCLAPRMPSGARPGPWPIRPVVLRRTVCFRCCVFTALASKSLSANTWITRPAILSMGPNAAALLRLPHHLRLLPHPDTHPNIHIPCPQPRHHGAAHPERPQRGRQPARQIQHGELREARPAGNGQLGT